MANFPPYGSSGPPHPPYPGSTSGLAPRRSSYASVAAGTTGSYNQNSMAISRPGAFSYLATPNHPSPLYMPGGSSRPSRQRSGSDTQMDEGINVPGSWGQSGVINYTSQYGTGQVFGRTVPGDNIQQSGFFVPSYLRNSRFMERLQAAHDSKTAAQRETASTHTSGKGTLSSRSSNVSLPKLAPSHRGMTYEIIEHQPPETHDGWSPLPTKWAKTDKNQCLAIGDDGLEVRFTGGQKLQETEAAATRADHPMPVYGGMYYYEVMIISNGKDG